MVQYDGRKHIRSFRARTESLVSSVIGTGRWHSSRCGCVYLNVHSFFPNLLKPKCRCSCQIKSRLPNDHPLLHMLLNRTGIAQAITISLPSFPSLTAVIYSASCTRVGAKKRGGRRELACQSPKNLTDGPNPPQREL